MRGMLAFCAGIAVPAIVAAPSSAEPSVRMVSTTAAGVPLKVIIVNLNDANVKITGSFTKFGAGHSEPFAQMVRRAEPTVALTGTFFCTRSKRPIGDIVIDGQLTHFGGLGTALCITESNEVEFIRPEKYTHQDWSRFDFVVCSGPRLVKNGVAYVEPRSEGFRDKRMLRRNGRLAIGVTEDNRLIIAVTRKKVYLSRMAKAMKWIGVRDAINLDAGSSMGLHYKGQTMIQPKRWLTNLVLVYQDRIKYEDLRDNLLPVRFRSAQR